MLRIAFLPAQQGDAIWIEYGTAGEVHRVLIDAGTPATAPLVRKRMESLGPGERTFDLLVVTHVDTDHIGGILKVLSDLPSNIAFQDVWFNGWPQIRAADSSRLGPVDGEILSAVIEKRKWPWNAAFDGAAVMAAKDASAPTKTLPGGMRLTVLSPGAEQLAKLRDEWKSVVQDAGLDPSDRNRWKKLLESAARKGVKSSLLGVPKASVLAGSKFEADTSVANGSSIGLLAEFDGKSVLFSGDAHVPVLLASVNALLRSRGISRLKLDAFKLPHHGSSGNVSNELLAALPASKYIFSTSGAVFGHPDDEAVARTAAAKTGSAKLLLFNYTASTIAKNYKRKKQRAQPDWEDGPLRRQYNYELRFPANDDDGVVVEL